MKIGLLPEFDCGRLSPRLQSLFVTLREPQEEAALEKRGEEAGVDFASFYFTLGELKKMGQITYHTPLLSCFGLQEMKAVQDGAYRLSRFAHLRLDEGELVLETPLSPAKIWLKGRGALDILYRFRSPSPLGKKLDPATQAILVACEILTCEGESVALRQWEAHDLYFHSRSRLGQQGGGYGGTYRFEGELDPLPATKTVVSGEKIPLQAPEVRLDLGLSDVFEKRRSIRKQGERPISLRELGDFLYHTARVKRVEEVDGQEYAYRTYPGGGGRYELEIYPIIHRCEGLGPAIYHYQPAEHALYRIADLDQRAEQLLKDARDSIGGEVYPQVLLTITARFQRVSYKYQSMAYALILKDLGVLYQTFYLAATAMGLAPCALGGGNSDHFSNVTGIPYLEEASLGEFILGSCR